MGAWARHSGLDAMRLPKRQGTRRPRSSLGPLPHGGLPVDLVPAAARARRVKTRQATTGSGGIEHGCLGTTLLAEDRADLGDLVGPSEAQPQQDSDAEH
jgi:hypothetical protein